MRVIVSRLPKSWRNSDSVQYLQDFISLFLSDVLNECKKIGTEKKKMISVQMLNIALSKLGFSMRMINLKDPALAGSFSVTQSCIQKAIEESKVHVQKAVRWHLRVATQSLINGLVLYARAFQKPVEKSPASVIAALRDRMTQSK